ncbi:MAG: hypothetical protein UHO11_11680 [Treponema sp.]|nr:hypothetical protein [Treponema sp.]
MMKKLFCLLFIFFSLCGAMFADVRIGLCGNYLALPFCYMLDTDGYIFIKFDTAQALVTAMKEGTVDAANLPVHLALRLEKITGRKIQAAAVTSYTDTVLVSYGAEASAFSDLLGKQVYTVSGSAEDMFLRFLLEKNAVPVKSGETGVEIVRAESSAEIVSLLASGRINYGVLSEPFSSASIVASSEIKAAIDFQDEYSKIYGPEKHYPKNVLVVRKSLALSSADFSELKKNLAASISQINANPVKSARLMKKAGYPLPAYSGGRSVIKSSFVFVPLDKELEIQF